MSYWDEKVSYYRDGALKLCKDVDWEECIKKQEPGVDWPDDVDFNCMNRLLRGQTLRVELESVLDDEDAISCQRAEQQRERERRRRPRAPPTPLRVLVRVLRVWRERRRLTGAPLNTRAYKYRQ